LADALQKAETPGPIREIQASFRGELREYRDKTQLRVTRMHNEVGAAAAVMESLAASVASDSDDHESQLKAEMDGLQTALSSGDADQLRSRAQSAIAGIARYTYGIRKSNQLIIAQLHDEIRMLHQEMGQRERVKNCDAITGAWNSAWVDASIAEMVRLDDPFSVVVFRVLNLNRVEAHHTRAGVDGALKALVERLCQAVGERALVGRRSEEQFVAILKDAGPTEANALCAELTRVLNGPYAIQENGKSQNVALQVACGVTERPQGADGEGFRHKLAQLSGVLAAG
jgi:GGDEF domain-containing protein